MFIKLHEPTRYQQFLLAAEHRTALNDYDRHQLFNYLRGQEGERYFYELVKTSAGVKLWDISLDYRKGSQYDFLIFDKRIVYHFDVKNFTGSYKLVNQQFVSQQGYVHADVLSQLNKAHYKLEEFLKSQLIQMKVVSRVLFVNHQYELPDAHVPDKVLLPHQVQEVVQYIHTIRPSQEHVTIADKIKACHRNELVKERIHYYAFEDYRQGIRCEQCRQLSMIPDCKKRYISCINCRYRVDNKTALLALIKEMFLLKNDALSAAEVSRWSGIPQQTVRRIMADLCHTSGANKNRQYILK
ncbi:nuclease-related domain-containing protein [Macrococcus equipercicus]|uniref:NERD domain-containing protein n=1 Tax=Macrococcus equipercicus TaxID=69967 RepID=A0A9Q9BPT0_9STAP|nr:nuclease-related domain-containing protein [Macrococcus equipercicus]KAA1037727.1 NERD domain-containing protein [Macrococcus equipercicus]UTH13441.1 NERD domain-containing protein [Macrococcus equipercicus]